MRYPVIIFFEVLLFHFLIWISAFIDNEDQLMMISRFIIFLYVVLLFSYYVFIRRLFRQLQERESQLHFKEQAKLQVQQKQELMKVNKEARAVKNLSISQLGLLRKQLECDQFADALETVNEHRQDIKNASFPIYSSNSLVNAILYIKERLAHDHHIRVNYQVVLPENLTLSPSTISSLYCNLLDNAINGCSASAASDPYIILRTYFRADFIYITMQNSKNPYVHYTNAKADPYSMHGIGLTILDEIANDNGGILEYEDKGDTFVTSILIQYESTAEKYKGV